jgi:hypothetical protein
MRFPLIFLALACLVAGEALSQVPVADSARESTEQGIAKCMTTANASRFATVSPSRGTQGSMAAPGAANAAATSAVGGADLTGGAGSGLSNVAANAGAGASSVASSAGSGAPSAVSLNGSSASNVGQGTGAGVSPASISTIGGVNLSALAGSGGASFNMGNAVQIFKAVSGVSPALQTNSGALTAAGMVIGSINAAQGGWDQNSGARIAQTANWNQVAQTVMTTVQLRNQILTAHILAASAAAAAMKPN